MTVPADSVDLITPEFFHQALSEFAQLLGENEQKINELNVYPVPDSDTGTNSRLTLESGMANLGGLSVADLANSLANGATDRALGNSGVILAAYFSGLANELVHQHKLNDSEVDHATWQAALAAAALTARESVLHPAQGTMLSIADSVIDTSAESLGAQLVQNSKSARTALVKTQDQLPELTRAGVVDAGAVVLTLFHDAFAKLVASQNFEPLQILSANCDFSASNLENGYAGPMHELMFTIAMPIKNKVKLIQLLEANGDSIALTEKSHEDSQEILNYRVHIHCDIPDDLITKVKILGQVSDLVLVNLKLKAL